MSEQRIPLLIASGGLLCLLLQLVLSMTDSPARRAQLVAQRVAIESVYLRSEKRAERLAQRLNQAMAAGDQSKLQAELDSASQSDPDIVEIGVVDHDLSVVASSEKTQVGKRITGHAEELLRKAVEAGFSRKVEASPQNQRVILAVPVTGQPGSSGLLYLVLTTADMEDGLGRVVTTVQPQRVPTWLTIGLGILGVGVALAMWVLGDRKRSIRGFDVGLQGVCAGERRLVTIPPAWAYGAKGLGPIPPESTLKFEIEVLEVADAPTTPDAAAAPSPPQASWNDWLIFVLLIGSVAGLTLYYQKKYKTQKKMKANGKKGVGTPKAIVRLAQELKKKNAVSVAAADEKSQ